jgi:hypothetical protein
MHQLGHAVEHRLSFMSGQDIDQSDNESNLAHMACRDLLALNHQINKTAIDDRPARYYAKAQAAAMN